LVVGRGEANEQVFYLKWQVLKVPLFPDSFKGLR
jgi:hypothetical protein